MLDRIIEKHPNVRDLLWESYFRRAFHSMMASSALFSALTPEELTVMAVEIEPLLFETGDMVIRQGESPKGLYGVVGGNLAVVRQPSPIPRIITRLAPGDFFGLLSQVDAKPVRASIVATEESTLLWLPPEALESLRERMPAFEKALGRVNPGKRWAFKWSPAE